MPTGGDGINTGAGGDCGANLAEVLLGFTKKFFGFTVICGVFAFFGKGLGVPDEIEVAEVFFAFTNELDGHH